MTPQVFRERHLQLTFDTSWHVQKYDEHLDYNEKILKQIDGTKAVDFVATRRTGPRVLHFIEVKDFRTYPTEQNQELRSGELIAEIAQKVRDTLPGLIGAWRMSSQSDIWQPFIQGLHDRQTEIHVVLWLESNSPKPIGKPAFWTTLRANLQKRLRWLTTKVVISSLGQPHHLEGLTVISLPRNNPPAN